MNVASLQMKWDDVGLFENHNGYRVLRMSSKCLSNLFIGTDENGYRCFLLFIQKDIVLNIRSSDKNKLELSYFPNKGIILIKLKDSDYNDLFNDLILSLYGKLKSISDSKEASQELALGFYKWSQFFEDSLSNKLSEEQIQGLLGELFVLIEYLKYSEPNSINSLLTAWKGLYDAANDFEFDSKNVEVKTKKESKPFVKISSEFQLEKEFDKGLELIIVTVKIDLAKGSSIHELVLEIIDLIRGNFGDISILYGALNQKGLSLEVLKQYNNYRYIVLKTELYDTSIEGFPKLSKSVIPNEVSNLKYNLRITQLTPFLIESKTY